MENTDRAAPSAGLSDLWPCSLPRAQFPQGRLHQGFWFLPWFIITLPSLLHFHRALAAPGSWILGCHSRQGGFMRTRKASITGSIQHLPELYTCGSAREIKHNSAPKLGHPYLETLLQHKLWEQSAWIINTATGKVMDCGITGSCLDCRCCPRMSANINAKKPTHNYLNVSSRVCFYHINLFCFAVPFFMAKWWGKETFYFFFSPHLVGMQH